MINIIFKDCFVLISHLIEIRNLKILITNQKADLILVELK